MHKPPQRDAESGDRYPGHLVVSGFHGHGEGCSWGRVVGVHFGVSWETSGDGDYVFMWPFAGAGLAVLVIGTNGDDGGRPERGPGGLRQGSFGGGPTVVRDFLAAGLVDTMHVVQVPILLGCGVRLWDGLEKVEERYDIEAVSSPTAVTHVTFTRK